MVEELYHYGIKRKSGRYKWGSGDRPYQGDHVSTKANKLVDRLNEESIKQDYRETLYKSLEDTAKKKGAMYYARWYSSDSTSN